MLTTAQSLDLIIARVDLLGRGTRAHGRAAHRVLIGLTQRWAEPTDQYIDDSLEMAERIGQDLADITRHMTDLQLQYPKVLFEIEKA